MIKKVGKCQPEQTNGERDELGSSLALGLKRDLRMGEIAAAADEASSEADHSVPHGFPNGSVQPSYLRSLECEKKKVGKTETVAKKH